MRTYISVPALEEGWGWGSITEGVVETGNAELWSTLSVHDYSPWSVSMNLWKLIYLFFVCCCFFVFKSP